MKLQRLRELALGATQSEWKTVDHSWEYTGIYPETGGRLAVCEIDGAVTEDTQEHYEAINDANAAYIAAACPANILPFIESYEELLAALKDAKSVIGSINGGRSSRIVTDDGEVVYTQTEEWVAWSRDEILPLAVKAITNAEKLNHE